MDEQQKPFDNVIAPSTGASAPKKIAINDGSAPAPEISPAAVEQPPQLEPAAPVLPPPQSEAAPIPPPTTPDNIPHFGELQPKIDAHPLFSGAKEPEPKRPSRFRKWTFAPLIVLVIVAVAVYLLMDAGVIKGASHLPFHVFKQPVATVAPTITPQQNATNTQPTTTNPYANWKDYSSTTGKFSLKYPSTWVVPDNLSLCSGILLLAPDTKSLGKCATESFGEMAFFSVDGDKSADYAIKATDGYAGLTSTPVTVQGVTGAKYVATAQGQQNKPGVGTLPDNTKVVEYVFYTSGKTYVASYNQVTTYSDVLNDFNSIITATLKFSS